MNLRFRLVSALLSLTALTAACHDGSGLEDSNKVSALSAPDLEQLCDWYVDVLDAPREVQCGTRTRRFVESSECQRKLGRLSTRCTVTVDEYEACIEAMVEDPCGSPDACKTLNACD